MSMLCTSISVSLLSSAFSYAIAQLFRSDLLTLSSRLFVWNLIASFYLVVVFIVALFNAFGKHFIAILVAASVVRVGVIAAFSRLRLCGYPSTYARLLLIDLFTFDVASPLRHRIPRINRQKCHARKGQQDRSAKGPSHGNSKVVYHCVTSRARKNPLVHRHQIPPSVAIA